MKRQDRRGARKRQADKTQNEQADDTHKWTGAQTGLGRSQSEAHTNTNGNKDRQIDRGAGIQVMLWVRQRQADR